MIESSIETLMAQAQQRIEKRLIIAYALLPPILLPNRCTKPEELKAKYEAKDWRQVLILLQIFSATNDFPLELHQHIEAVYKLFSFYDSLGMSAVLNQFSDEEKHIVGECLHASVHGPFFEGVLEDLFVVEQEEIIRIANIWPDIDPTDCSVSLVINDAFNHLLGYPHKKHEEWPQHISVSPANLYMIYHKFRKLVGMTNTQYTGKTEYFNNIL